MREATAALATARVAQIRFTRRNAETKAWAIAVWMAELVCEARPSGTSRPAEPDDAGLDLVEGSVGEI